MTGCFQTTAMVGPAFTLVSTGNISQAGMTFLTNKAIKKETGLNTLEFVSNKTISDFWNFLSDILPSDHHLASL